MIKINLLPHAKRAKTSDMEKQIMLFVLLIIVLCSGILATGIWTQGKTSDLEKLVEEKQIQRQMLLSKVGRVNQLQKELEGMSSNIEAIKKIRSQQQLPVRYIHEMARRLPEESIWFESLNLSRNALLEVSGVALDNQVFARYVDSLRDSPFISSVNTQRTSRRQVANRNLIEFLCQINAGPEESSSMESVDED